MKKALYNEIMALVERQIIEGTLKGETTIDGTIASWNGTDKYNYTLTAAPANK